MGIYLARRHSSEFKIILHFQIKESNYLDWEFTKKIIMWYSLLLPENKLGWNINTILQIQTMEKGRAHSFKNNKLCLFGPQVQSCAPLESVIPIWTKP